MLDILSEKRRKINWKKKDYTKYNRERQKSVSAPIPLYPKKKKKKMRETEIELTKTSGASSRKARTKEERRENAGKNGRRNKAEMKEPVRVAHGSYGCKSA